MFNWTISVIIHKRKEVIVPSLIGKSLMQAFDIISKYNLSLKKIASEFNENFPAGTITRQDPTPGMMVREGKVIKVVLSEGGELIFVPNAVGLNVRKAELIIRKEKLQIGSKVELYSLKYERDTVIEQEPKPDTIVPKDTAVNLTVSLGRPPEGIILMPDFINKNIEEFKKWCSQNNFQYNIQLQKNSLPYGIITQLEPPPDTVVFKDNVLKVTISNGESSDLEGISGTEKFYYEVPAGTKEQKIKIVLIDENGEREIYSNVNAPGTKLRIPIVNRKGKSKIRIFINEILVEEKEL